METQPEPYWQCCCVCLPEEASSEIDFFVMCDMKPTIEKITNPANMLVVEFIQQTIMESLQKRIEETSCKTLPERQEAKGGQAEDEAFPLGRWQRAPQLRGDTGVGLPDSL